MNDFDAGVFFGTFIGDGARVVGGAVIDKEDFEVVMSLGKDRIETGREVFGSIINWNNDGYFVIHVIIITCDRGCGIMWIR